MARGNMGAVSQGVCFQRGQFFWCEMAPGFTFRAHPAQCLGSLTVCTSNGLWMQQTRGVPHPRQHSNAEILSPSRSDQGVRLKFARCRQFASRRTGVTKVNIVISKAGSNFEGWLPAPPAATSKSQSRVDKVLSTGGSVLVILKVSPSCIGPVSCPRRVVSLAFKDRNATVLEPAVC